MVNLPPRAMVWALTTLFACSGGEGGADARDTADVIDAAARSDRSSASDAADDLGGPAEDGSIPPMDGSADAIATPDARPDGGIPRDATAVDADALTPAPMDARADVTVPSDASPFDARADAAAPTDPLAPALAPAIDMDPSRYPSNVWITDTMVKVQPGATPTATSARWATLAAARNEFESFQVHVRAGASAITGLEVTLSDLTDARSGTVIRAADRAVIFREEYLSITTPSDLNGLVGMVPDPLIPAVDPLVRERRNAFPATVPASSTRSYWVELFVPPGTPSGYYTGTVTVRAGATVLSTMPVRLEVWSFDLPSTSSLPNFFAAGWNALCVAAYGSYPACGAFPGAGGNPDVGIERTHILTARFLLDYRLTNAEAPYAGTDVSTSWTAFDALYGPLLEGTADTRLRGARMTSLAYVGVPDDYRLVQRWAAHARDRGWSDRLFYYHCDEPPYGCPWSQVTAEATAVRALSPAPSVLLTAGIEDIRANRLEGLVGIATPLVDLVQPRTAPSTRPLYDSFLAMPGKKLWWYQDCTEHESCENGRPGSIASLSPTYMADSSPVRNRVFQWMAHLYRIGGELYHGTDYCWTHACGAGTRDPWTSIYSFGGHGDGTLTYPGTPARIGGSTPIPVPSIRLEHIRDGMEDYEYLRALSVAGEGAFAEAQARTFITTAHTFSSDPARLSAARRALGQRLHARGIGR
jgi:hypothetical protein